MKTVILFCFLSFTSLLGFSQSVPPVAAGTKFHPSNELSEGQKKNSHATINNGDTLHEKKTNSTYNNNNNVVLTPEKNTYTKPSYVPLPPVLTKEDSLRREKLNKLSSKNRKQNEK